MSASLQYSDYSGSAAFVVPYALLNDDKKRESYLLQCELSLKTYESLIASGVDNDTAGYVMPQGLRNVLLISATPFQWRHMISQRICRRNTSETRYVMLRIWELLQPLSPALFDCATSCMEGPCKEGKMSCGLPLPEKSPPHIILAHDFPQLMLAKER